MNPSGIPKSTLLLPPAQSGSTTSAADKILEQVKDKNPGIVPHFNLEKFIRDFEQDCVDRKYGHLGVGDYDKLLIESVQQNIDFVPERDKDIHLLITQSVGRYDVKTRNRINK